MRNKWLPAAATVQVYEGYGLGCKAEDSGIRDGERGIRASGLPAGGSDRVRDEYQVKMSTK